MTLHITPGTTHGLDARAGAQLAVHEGRVVVTLPPMWLAHTLHCPRLVLHAGERHTLAMGGWLQIHGTTPAARVELLAAPPGWLACAWAWTWRWAGGRLGRLSLRGARAFRIGLSIRAGPSAHHHHRRPQSADHPRENRC